MSCKGVGQGAFVDRNRIAPNELTDDIFDANLDTLSIGPPKPQEDKERSCS